jgi:hypothetical protein
MKVRGKDGGGILREWAGLYVLSRLRSGYLAMFSPRFQLKERG